MALTRVTYSMIDAVYVDRFGALGDGVTNDAAAIQAALDYAESLGGGNVVVPWPAVSYVLGTTQILIPNYCRLVGLGAPTVLSGGQQFTYSGSDAAFALKEAESDSPSRGCNIENIGVQITTASATGFRIWRARDLTLRNCAVLFGANNQVGFHIKGEKDGGTYGGVFDCYFERLIAYDSAGTLTGLVHYDLTGTLNDGQVNANTFTMIRGGGSGSFCNIGPSDGNTFVGPEAEAIDGDYFYCKQYAYNNKVFGSYVEAKAAWTGKIVKTDSGSLRNDFWLGTVGVNADLDTDLSLVDGNRVYWSGRAYTATEANPGFSIRLAGDAENGADLSKDGLGFGDGTTTPVPYAGPKADGTVALTLAASITPNLNQGGTYYLNINSATNPTINNPTNGYDGKHFTVEIVNNSGSTRTISWGAGFIPAADLPSTIAAGQRWRGLFTKRLTQFVLIAGTLT